MVIKGKAEKDIKDISGLQTAYLNAIEKALDTVAERIANQARRYLEQQGKFDTGELGDSIQVLEKKEGERLIGSSVSYAPFIEFGTGQSAEEPQEQYMPPYLPIREWVERKFSLKGRQAHRMTEKVRWKIYMHGTEPHPYLRPAYDEHAPTLPDEIKKEIEKIKI